MRIDGFTEKFIPVLVQLQRRATNGSRNIEIWRLTSVTSSVLNAVCLGCILCCHLLIGVPSRRFKISSPVLCTYFVCSPCEGRGLISLQGHFIINLGVPGCCSRRATLTVHVAVFHLRVFLILSALIRAVFVLSYFSNIGSVGWLSVRKYSS